MKRIQFTPTDDTLNIIEKLLKTANENFDGGSINYSDVLNEMVLTSNVDVPSLRIKHTNLRMALKSLATQEDLDVDAVIKKLKELKSVSPKKSKPAQEEMKI